MFLWALLWSKANILDQSDMSSIKPIESQQNAQVIGIKQAVTKHEWQMHAATKYQLPYLSPPPVSVS